jgi:aldehyde dehydrogenase (NAD+)
MFPRSRNALARIFPHKANLSTFHTSAALFSKAREPSDEFKFPDAGPLHTKLFINNQFVPSADGKTFPTLNPANGSVLAHVSEAGETDVARAVDAAHAAFTGPWSRMSPRERGACLFRLAALIEQNVTKLAVLESLDNGKPYSQSIAVDAPACATILRYYAGWADKITGRTIPIGPDHFCYTISEPVGVCALVVPWNLPLIAVAAKIGPCVATGNTCVLKSAENTPLTALQFAGLVAEAGFPEGVINIISGFGHKTGAQLVAHPKVNKVSFTGSVPVGKHIQASCANYIKRCTLELGGKNPVVVFADAKLDEAVEAVHNGLFWNDAEACASASRIFVEDAVYDEFVAKSVVMASKRRVGHPFDPATQQGSQVSEVQMNKILKYIEGAQAQGARLLTGGHRIGTKGNFLAPAVFDSVTDDMTIWREEVFGPVMTINRFSTKGSDSGLAELMRRVNDSPYGLAAGIFTTNMSKGQAVAKQVKAGMVFWNCYHVVDIAAPFGGMKQSGIGREGGEWGVAPYLETKMVAVKH